MGALGLAACASSGEDDGTHQSFGGTAGTGATGTGGTGGSGGAATGGTGAADAGCPAERQCGATCCPAGERCVEGVACGRTFGPCTTNDDCGSDSWCSAGTCVSYGAPPTHDHDTTCARTIDIAAITPSVQCRWTGPPAGDAAPDHVHVMSTPVVVDFDLDGDPRTLDPSIVFASFPTAGSYTQPGALRVIRGADCTQIYSAAAGADAVMAPASPAVGDLDGDGHAEIVAAAHGGGLLAFRWDAAAGTFVRAWRSGTCVGGVLTAPDSTGGGDQWAGPSLHDLDDDGSAEILYGAVVYGADGCIRSAAAGYPAYHRGVVPVVADVDEDGRLELVLGSGVWEWNTPAGALVAESYVTTPQAEGQVAVAELGQFPVAALGGADYPEIVVVSSGAVRVQTLEGAIVFGPVAIPGGGTGGPPTVADFDGDGRREFASAGGSEYVVFDLDCVAGGDPAGCGGQARTDGVLWSRPSQDQSSNVTGSSVFDFDADGKAEAVYADECFLRVYDGATGDVRYSAARSSGTTYENPVIVDVDGDYRTEIVSSVNDYAGGLVCPATDPLYPAAVYERNHGIVVLRDELDRWASSRPVWNQHAYAVTHVGDHGELPRSSQVARNWDAPDLNNFRQNVQGGLEALGVPDLTAGGGVGEVQCNDTVATIEARVCNRGTLPMVSGTDVSFRRDSPTGVELCHAPIPIALQVAECTTVSCQTDLGGDTVDVFVAVDPGGASDECWELNNTTLYSGVACGQVPR